MTDYTVYRYSQNNPQQDLIWGDDMSAVWEPFMLEDPISRIITNLYGS